MREGEKFRSDSVLIAARSPRQAPSNCSTAGIASRIVPTPVASADSVLIVGGGNEGSDLDACPWLSSILVCRLSGTLQELLSPKLCSGSSVFPSPPNFRLK